MHGLAIELGMTVGQLGRQMSSNELMRWVAYYKFRNNTESDEAQKQAKIKLESIAKYFGGKPCRD